MQASQVQVWVARPAAFGTAECDRLRRLLDADERARGERLRAADDRRAHLVAHGVCRSALASVLGTAPQALRFSRDAHGKPSLLGAGSDLFFSLSHTRGVVVCAASYGGPIGIDVEPVDEANADAELLDLFMHAPAPGVLPVTGPAAFYAAWTALEAYWKARGTGLTSANPRLRLTRPAGWLQAALEHDATGESRLFITPVDAAPGAAVALACGWVPTLQLMHWGASAPEPAQRCDKPSLIFRGDEVVAAFS